MTNIVVFGKAHSGKSTLIGYIHSLQNGIYYSEEKLQKELGSAYRSDSFYSYQLDDSKNERSQQIIKRSENERTGTETIHYRNVMLPNGQEIQMIDTPGRDQLRKTKERGAFYGEVGIFCLELGDVADEKFDPDSEELIPVLSVLMLWSKFARKRIIVALTKSDLCDYSEKVFKIAAAKVHDVCISAGLEYITVIPIAVIVAERTGYNIDKKSKRLDWYSASTLCEVIDSEIKEASKNPRNNELLFCVERPVLYPQSHAGKIWIIKIIQGHLSVDDTILLSPVLTADKKKFISIEARVKTIREDIHKLEGKSEVSFVGSGSIVGLDLSDIYVDGRRIQKNDFETHYSTCGFSSGVDFIVSNKFKFSVKSELSEKFLCERQYSLIWFGKRLNFSVLHNCDAGDNTHSIITAQLTIRKIAIPVYPNGKYYFTSLIIRDEKKIQYYEAELLSLIQEDV